MRARHFIDCPNCQKEHDVAFYFVSPEDGDTETTKTECDCDCIFEVTASLDIDVFCKPPVIKSLRQDIDGDGPYTSFDPNQTKLL